MSLPGLLLLRQRLAQQREEKVMKRRMNIGIAALAAGLLCAGAHVLAGKDDVPPRAPSPDVSSHWAYRPVKRPDVPAVRQRDWVRTPIDAFVLARLEDKGLAPSPDADRVTFIRRATLDVWGVIPTPRS